MQKVIKNGEMGMWACKIDDSWQDGIKGSNKSREVEVLPSG
jgi:hypothetical protein